MKITKEFPVGDELLHTTVLLLISGMMLLILPSVQCRLIDECATKPGNDHFFIPDGGIGNHPDSVAPYSSA